VGEIFVGDVFVGDVFVGDDGRGFVCDVAVAVLIVTGMLFVEVDVNVKDGESDVFGNEVVFVGVVFVGVLLFMSSCCKKSCSLFV